MMAEPRYNFFAPSVLKFLTKFIEREMDDIVVMHFLRSHVVTEFKPNTMKKVNFLRVRRGACGPR
jgi:hypothetical protein